MMSLNFSIENILHANVTSFIVMVAIISFVCAKLKIGKVFDRQRDKIKEVVEASEKSKQLSFDNLDKIKQELKELPQKLDELEEEAKSTAETLVKNIEADTEAKKEILQSNMETALDYHVKIAKQKLSHDVSCASVSLAKDNFIQILRNNPDIQYKILNECIEKL